MTQIEHLREQAVRAERLARSVLDILTVSRLLEASQEYQRLANEMECRARRGIEKTLGQEFHS